MVTKRAPAEADAPSNRSKHRSGYIFFSSHILVVAFHVPPAFAQSASVFAAVAPAKAGPVNASAKATANVEMRIFMGFLRDVWTEPPQMNAFCETAFQEHPPPLRVEIGAGGCPQAEPIGISSPQEAERSPAV